MRLQPSAAKMSKPTEVGPSRTSACKAASSAEKFSDRLRAQVHTVIPPLGETLWPLSGSEHAQGQRLTRGGDGGEGEGPAGFKLTDNVITVAVGKELPAPPSGG